MACGQCGGGGQVKTGSDFGWGVCPNCSGTGNEPTGKKADWFFGDADKGEGNNNGGWFPCLTILSLMCLTLMGIAIGLWTL